MSRTPNAGFRFPDRGLGIVIATRLRSVECQRLCSVLEEQIASANCGPVEIVLVFDGCDPYAWVPRRPPYRVVHLVTRHGIAGARNLGISTLDCPVIAFLDDDAVPDEGWLSSLCEGLLAYPNLLAFGGWVRGIQPSNLYSLLRDRVYYREAFGAWYGEGPEREDHLGPPYLSGGNAAYRRAPLEGAGGFDALLPAYSDVELGRRLNVSSCGVLLAGMSIRHHHPATLTSYLLRCSRSGTARALMWRNSRYLEHSPVVVLGGATLNLVVRNFVRALRLPGREVQAFGVLALQEATHVFAYVQTIVKSSRVLPLAVHHLVAASVS